MIFISGCVFTLIYFGDDFLTPEWVTILQILFLVFVTISRCGLYGFEIGEVQMLQQGIPVAQRGEANSVEGSLTSMASMIVYVCGLVVSNPDYFIGLVWGSVFFVGSGMVVYLVWRLRWSMEFEEHTHDEEDVDHNAHFGMHLEEHEEELKKFGKHAHVHFQLYGI